VAAQIGRRLLLSLAVLLFAALGVFLLLHLMPGDPVLMYAGPDASPEVVAAVRTAMGLNRPLAAQFIPWIAHAIRGDLGRSYASGIPVRDLVLARLPATLELAVSAILLTILVAIPLGVGASVRQGSRFDLVLRGVSAVALAVPNFWVGILLILAFALGLGWLPPGGYVSLASAPMAHLRFLLLPAVTLSLSNLAVLSHFVRSSMIEVLHQDYVRTARAKGLSPAGVVYRHALRNAMIPVLTVLGLQFGRMLGGVVIVETVFSWPGLGRLILQGLGNRDYAVVQGALLGFLAMFVLVSVVVDVATIMVNPRLRGHAV
jgi:peptide/nickel transport system permease protein